MSEAFKSAEALQRAVGQLPAGALATTRRKAAESFSQRGFPTTRQEDWRYTSLARVATIGENWLQSERAQQGEWPAPASEALHDIMAEIDATWIVLANGRVQFDASAAAEDGVSIQRISEHATAAQELRTDSPLEALNAALLHDGIVIRVARDVIARRPIGLLFFDDSDGENSFSQARLLVEAGEDSKLELVELHYSQGAAAQASNVVSQFDLKTNSRICVTRIVDRAATHLHTGKVAVTVGQDAKFRYAGFDLGGALIRNDIEVTLAEPGAAVELNGLYLASGKQHIDNHTRVDHRVGPSTSSEEYRGLLTGESKCVFNGKAIVHAGADGSDAQQANHNMLLSDRAEIDTKPELEIYADEVKCSHGATVGQLDQTALFYLRSRGLDRQTAMRILTRAFATKIVDSAPVAAARDYLGLRTEARLAEIVSGEPE